MDKRTQEYIFRIETSKSLPTLPHILVKLMSACQDENCSVQDMSRIIHADISMAARILKLANSAYFRTTEKISRIDYAITRMGRDAVKNLAVSSAIHQVFGKTTLVNNGFDLKRFWRHSLTTAVLARMIAGKSGYNQPEQAFLAGMIHDIGRLILSANFPYEYQEVLSGAGSDKEPIFDREIRMMAPHTEIGVWLLKKWNLDSLTIDAVLYHHETVSRIQESFPLVKIIFAANDLARGTPLSDPTFSVLKSLFTDVSPDTGEMLLAADEEVQKLADFLGLPVGEKELPGPTDDSTDLKPPELISEVKNLSLLVGSLQNLISCAGEDAILEVIQDGLSLLFDVQKVIFFLVDPDDGFLKAKIVRGPQQTESPPGWVISLHNSESLVTQSLRKNIRLSSPNPEAPAKPVILDEQIRHLLECEQILCVPLSRSGEKIGVIVIGLDEQDDKTVLHQEKLLGLYAAQASTALYAERLKQIQTRKITAERLSAMTDFARKVVHETNNPLAIIKNYLRVLSSCLDKESPAQQELQIIGEEIDRISRILKKLSDFSKEAVLTRTVLNVNTLLGDIIRIITPSFPETFDIKIHTDFGATVPPIRSDRDALKQVFINLIKNAVEALAGRGNIYVETDFVAGITDTTGQQIPFHGRDQVKIVIRDDGPGISPQVGERLFEPYVSTKGDGHSGIGLSVVYNMIKELGGSVVYGNASGKGAAFTIMLPVEPS